MLYPILSPLEDITFKALFTNPAANISLRSLISALTEIKVKSVEIRSNEPHTETLDEKAERFDVRCQVGETEQVEIEMQACQMSGDNALNEHREMRDRTIYYLSDLHAKQPKKNRYSDFMRSFQIAICDYTLFPDDDEFYHISRYTDQLGNVYSDKTTIINIELTKLAAILSKPFTELSEREKWAIYLKCVDQKDQQSKEFVSKINEMEEFKVATQVLSHISQDENHRYVLDMKRKAEMDKAHGLEVARQEGRQEGIEIGRAKERKIAAQAVKKTKYDKAITTAKRAIDKGLSLADAAELADLPLAEVEALVAVKSY